MSSRSTRIHTDPVRFGKERAAIQRRHPYERERAVDERQRHPDADAPHGERANEDRGERSEP